MANTFKVITFAAEPDSAGSPYTMYETPSSRTTVVIGLILTNIHTSQVTVEVELSSNTGSRGGPTSSLVSNTNSFLAKNVPLAVGQSIEILTGGKVILEATDAILIDCSVTDKVSGTLSIMEIS